MALVTLNTYDVGDLIRCSVVFATIAGVDTDPTTVIFRYQDPSGNITVWTFGVDVEVVQDAVGRYHADVSIDEEGSWFYRWEGTGVLQGAGESTFLIRDSKFTA